MTSVTYDQLVCMDPTSTYQFKGVILLERLITRIRLRFLLEMTRLLMLGFYDDFQTFLQNVESAEHRSRSESEFRAIFGCKLRAAQATSGMIERLQILEGLRYRERDLLDYLIGRDRLEELSLFVKATMIENEAEGMLDEAKREFLKSFAKRKLTKVQRAAILQKYDELSPRAPRIS